ncbi:MAG: hypothetical protein ABIA74_04025 [bacterium]
MFKFKKSILFLFCFFFISQNFCNPFQRLSDAVKNAKFNIKMNKKRSRIINEKYFSQEDEFLDADEIDGHRERHSSLTSSEYVNSEPEGCFFIDELKKCFKKPLMLQINEKKFTEIISVENCLLCIQFFLNENLELAIYYLNRLLDAMDNFFFERVSNVEIKLKKYSGSEIKKNRRIFL